MNGIKITKRTTKGDKYFYYRYIKSEIANIRTFHAWPITIQIQTNPGVLFTLSIGSLNLSIGGHIE